MIYEALYITGSNGNSFVPAPLQRGVIPNTSMIGDANSLPSIQSRLSRDHSVSFIPDY
jgi:hypothetical protein